MLLRPTWLRIPGCLALGEWAHYHDYLGCEICFVQFFCVFLPPLLNISCCFSVHTVSVLYCAHLCMKCFLSISNFLEGNSHLSHSIVFFSFHWSLRKAFSYLHSYGYIFSFSPLPLTSLLFSAICKAISENHFAFLHFFFLGDGLVPCLLHSHEPPSIVHQALCLSDLMPWIYFSLPLYNHMGFDLGHTWVVWWFSLLSSISVWTWQQEAHDLSRSQLPVLFLQTL